MSKPKSRPAAAQVAPRWRDWLIAVALGLFLNACIASLQGLAAFPVSSVYAAPVAVAMAVAMAAVLLGAIAMLPWVRAHVSARLGALLFVPCTLGLAAFVFGQPSGVPILGMVALVAVCSVQEGFLRATAPRAKPTGGKTINNLLGGIFAIVQTAMTLLIAFMASRLQPLRSVLLIAGVMGCALLLALIARRLNDAGPATSVVESIGWPTLIVGALVNFGGVAALVLGLLTLPEQIVGHGFDAADWMLLGAGTGVLATLFLLLVWTGSVRRRAGRDGGVRLAAWGAASATAMLWSAWTLEDVLWLTVLGTLLLVTSVAGLGVSLNARLGRSSLRNATLLALGGTTGLVEALMFGAEALPPLRINGERVLNGQLAIGAAVVAVLLAHVLTWILRRHAVRTLSVDGSAAPLLGLVVICGEPRDVALQVSRALATRPEGRRPSRLALVLADATVRHDGNPVSVAALGLAPRNILVSHDAASEVLGWSVDIDPKTGRRCLVVTVELARHATADGLRSRAARLADHVSGLFDVDREPIVELVVAVERSLAAGLRAPREILHPEPAIVDLGLDGSLNERVDAVVAVLAALWSAAPQTLGVVITTGRGAGGGIVPPVEAMEAIAQAVPGGARLHGRPFAFWVDGSAAHLVLPVDGDRPQAQRLVNGFCFVAVDRIHAVWWYGPRSA